MDPPVELLYGDECPAGGASGSPPEALILAALDSARRRWLQSPRHGVEGAA